MNDKKRLNRRGFLKLSIAAAAAAGLSHFRFLNLGGVKRAFAQGCDYGEEPDLCIPQQENIDICVPGSEPDICAPSGGDPDVCGGVDPDYYCSEPMSDVCDPAGSDPDLCNPMASEPDECIQLEDTDYACPVVGSDFCNASDPDLCIPWEYEPDVCDASSTDEPTAVDVESFNAASGSQPISWASAILGGMAAALTIFIAKFRSHSKEDESTKK